MTQMLAGNPYAQYQQAQLETAPPERLLIMLYEGAIRFCNAARKGIEERNYQKAHDNFLRVQAIITELMATLNMQDGGEVAQNLFNLYEFLNHQLTLANTQKSVDRLDEALAIIRDLHEAWVQAAKNVGAAKKASA